MSIGDNYYFIVKETDTQMEIFSGHSDYTDAYTEFQELVSKWKGRTSNFILIQCPIVQQAKVHGEQDENSVAPD